jgi:hypothetical protein
VLLAVPQLALLAPIEAHAVTSTLKWGSPIETSFVDGAAISTSTADGQLDAYTSVPEILNWHAKSATGVCGYTLTWSDDYGGSGTLVKNTGATSYKISASNYDDSYGGGSGGNTYYEVTATECGTGAKIKSDTIVLPTVIQDDGSQIAWSRPEKLTYNGNWTTSKCACFSGGSNHHTTTPGASASLTLKKYGSLVAVVMEKGSNRGAVRIYVNDHLMSTVDTYSYQPDNRIMVWQGRVGANSTVKIVNVGTAGRPRVDIDAFVAD